MLKVGVKPKQSNKLIFSIPKNSSITVKVLVNTTHIIAGDICTYGEYAWEYSGEGDPIHELGGAPWWMAVVPVHMRVDGEIKLIYLRLPSSALERLISQSGSTGLRGRVFEIKRIDEGQDKFTKYQIIDKNKISAVEESEDSIVQAFLDKLLKGTQEDIRKVVGKPKEKKFEEEVL